MPQPTPKQLAANVDPKTRDYIDAVIADMQHVYGGAIDALRSRIDHLEHEISITNGELNAQVKSTKAKIDAMRTASGRKRGVK